MRSWARFWLYAVVFGAMVFTVGCEGQKTDDADIGNVKKHRLIAAENLALQKQIAELKGEIQSLNDKIAKLNADHAAQLESDKKALEQVKVERDTWKTKATKGVKEEINAVLMGVMKKSEELRAENEALKAEIVQLKGAKSEQDKPKAADTTPQSQ